MFSPKAFPNFAKNFPTTVNVEQHISTFCKTYGIDPHQCAKELISFASAFELFQFITDYKYDDDEDEELVIEGSPNDDSNESSDSNDLKQNTFIDCLSIRSPPRGYSDRIEPIPT